MKTTLPLILATLGLAACGPSNYSYSFDILDPGAHNVNRSDQGDMIEDADVRVSILVDPTSFQAIALDVFNKTEQPLFVNWNNVMIIGPDGTQTPLHPDAAAQNVEPGGRLVARLVTFALPTRGGAATSYDNSHFELVVPMAVRGQPREYRYHLLAHTHSI